MRTGILFSLLLVPFAALSEPLVLEGEATAEPPAFVMLPFEVPAGVREIRVDHRSLTGGNVLDWGLWSPDGFRGWGGGNTEPIVVNEKAASRSYLPGPLTPGTWHVLLGKAQILNAPAKYRVEIELREEATLAHHPDTKPYVAAEALSSGPRWYAGDLHVHSSESGDANASLDEIATLAKERGLDFVVITDHNTTSHLELLVAAQARHPDVLLIPGVEFTTYAGHANGLGATRYVDHRLGTEGVSIESAALAFEEQGAIFSINHPMLDFGDLCIGCAWEHEIDPSLVGAVEIATGAGTVLFAEQSIAFWDALCDQGHRIAAVGGSDDHRAGRDTGITASRIGSPTTMVHADRLDAESILRGIREGRTVVKMRGPEDPMVQLFTDGREEGDLSSGAWRLTVRVTGGEGGTLRLVRGGEVVEEVEVDADPFVLDRALAAVPEGKQERWRAELLFDGRYAVVTSHVWLSPPGPKSTPCGCDGAGAGALALIALLVRRRR